MKPKILCFAGSLRKDSFNKKLVKVGMKVCEEAGAEATFVDLKELNIPMYDGDLEDAEGIPEGAVKLRKLMLEHQGLLIASPEYNSSISGALKNAIDWASRPTKTEESLLCFKDKVAGLLAASPGAFGGLRGLVSVRSILGNIKVIVIPEQHTVPKVQDAFNEDGTLTDSKTHDAVANVAKRLVEVTRKLHCS